jgi:hypothetical protein
MAHIPMIRAAERMTEKSAVTPSGRSVQIKKKAPLDFHDATDSRTLYVNDGDEQYKERPEEDDERPGEDGELP